MDKPQEPLGSNTSAGSNRPITPVGVRMAGLRSGDGPLSVRARPSGLKRDCDRRTTSGGDAEGCYPQRHGALEEDDPAMQFDAPGDHGAQSDQGRQVEHVGAKERAV